MKLFSLLLVAVSFAGVSCERHDFAETRKLQEHHGPAGGHAGHDDHAAHDDHEDHDDAPAH